jgi:hypothetical protein
VERIGREKQESRCKRQNYSAKIKTGGFGGKPAAGEEFLIGE